MHKNHSTEDGSRTLHFEYSTYDRQRSSHTAMDPNQAWGYLLTWVCLKQANTCHLRSRPHLLNRICTCVWLLFEGGYYQGTASIRINTVFELMSVSACTHVWARAYQPAKFRMMNTSSYCFASWTVFFCTDKWHTKKKVVLKFSSSNVRLIAS